MSHLGTLSNLPHSKIQHDLAIVLVYGPQQDGQ
jgi:hypothetical protein